MAANQILRETPNMRKIIDAKSSAPPSTGVVVATFLILTVCSGAPELMKLVVLMVGLGVSALNLLTELPTLRYSRSVLACLVLWMTTVSLDISGRVSVAVLAISITAIVPSRPERCPPATRLVLTYLVAISLATLLSMNTGRLLGLLILAVSTLPAFALTGWLPTQALPPVFRSVLSLCLVEALLALIQLGYQPPGLKVGEYSRPENAILGHGIERTAGSLDHPLLLGMFLTVGVALAVWTRTVQKPALRLLSVLVLFLGLIAADARLNIAVCVGVVMAYGVRRWVQKHGGLVLGWLAMMALLIAGLYPDLAEYTETLREEGSFTHRVGAITAIPRLLFHQDTMTMLVGNGLDSVKRLFGEGLLQDSYGFFAVDNEIVLTLAVGGLLAASALIAMSLVTFTEARLDIRPAVVVVIANFFAFDTLNWPATCFMTFLVFGAAVTTERPDLPVDPIQSPGYVVTRL